MTKARIRGLLTTTVANCPIQVIASVTKEETAVRIVEIVVALVKITPYFNLVIRSTIITTQSKKPIPTKYFIGSDIKKEGNC